MKLSHIRNLSWTLSLISLALASFFILRIAKSTSFLPAVSIDKWKPAPPKVDDLQQKELLTSQQLMRALSFLTKVDPPPRPPVVVLPPKVDTPVIPPPPPELKLDIKLVVISYDDSPAAMHLAFLKYSKNSPTHPYFVGDTIEKTNQNDPVVKVKEIHKQYVIIKAEDGREQKLEYHATKVKSNPMIASSLKRETRTKKVEQKPAPKPVVVSKKNEYRIVPTTRRVTKDKEYGINIVEYNEGNEDKRFAISDSDLSKLQEQQFRLLSEVSPDIAYSNTGQAVGVQLNFMVDHPLLEKYGIQNSDIVTHVNDLPVKNVDEGMNIYNNLAPNTRRVKILVQRGTQKRLVYFEMDDFKGVQPPK